MQITKKEKPKKPYADFPLFAHAAGQWAKKIRGRLHYFGVWADWRGALGRYLDQRDFLYADREPPVASATLADLLNSFRRCKVNARELGELSERSFGEYQAVWDTIAETLGEGCRLAMIGPDELSRLRRKLVRRADRKLRSPTSQKRLLAMARMVFRYANEEFEPPLERKIRYRGPLQLPSAKAVRLARSEVGERLFTAEEIRSLIAAAKPQMKAMIYLGINAGFGNKDCAVLPIDQVDLANSEHTYWRSKTGIARRCPLWPETAAALYAVIKKRTEGTVFVTKYGRPWEGAGTACPISAEFRKLAAKVGIYRKGVTTFYSLRRTFETIGASTGDQVAVDYIMGHAPATNDMAAVYRQTTFDSQLQRVTDHVQDWLNGTTAVA